MSAGTDDKKPNVKLTTRSPEKSRVTVSVMDWITDKLSKGSKQQLNRGDVGSTIISTVILPDKPRLGDPMTIEARLVSTRDVPGCAITLNNPYRNRGNGYGTLVIDISMWNQVREAIDTIVKAITTLDDGVHNVLLCEPNQD